MTKRRQNIKIYFLKNFYFQKKRGKKLQQKKKLKIVKIKKGEDLPS
jgi:hypothetical protein